MRLARFIGIPGIFLAAALLVGGVGLFSPISVHAQQGGTGNQTQGVGLQSAGEASKADILLLENPQYASLVSTCTGIQGTDPIAILEKYVDTNGCEKTKVSLPAIPGKTFSIDCGVVNIPTSGTSNASCRVISDADGSYASISDANEGGRESNRFKVFDKEGNELGSSNDTVGADGALQDKNLGNTEADAAANAARACYGLNFLSLGCLAEIGAKVAWFILLAVAAILGIANYLLGWTVYITVYQFGNLVGNSQGLLDAWGIVRDVGNILLLFGFIFMGISTILNLSHSEFTAKRALPALIIFALLMNFSLLAAEGIIDVSNAFATSIYNQVGGVCPKTEGTIDCAIDKGIGGAVMQMSGMSTILNLETIRAQDGTELTGETKLIIYIGLVIFGAITTLVLAAAAVMLLIRALILALLMVTSPIGFAGMAIPPLQEVAKKWWDQLIQQAIFAPVYFLLVLVSLAIMQGIIESLNGAGPSNQNLAAVFTSAAKGGTVSNITIGIIFALIIGFMIAALMFAKQSSAIGSGVAIKAGGSFAFGSLGFVGRQTAGRASLLAANRIHTSRFRQTGIGRMAFNVANKGASSSFDFRQSNSAPLKGLTKVAGDLGTTRKSVQHGMHGIEEASKKKKVDYAKQITQTHAEAHRQDELDAEQRQITTDRTNTQNQRREGERPLQQQVEEQTQQNRQNATARAREIATVQANVNQAVAAGDAAGAQNFQNQVNQLLAQNAQLTQDEQNELRQRREALEAHREETRRLLGEYDRRTERISAERNGGTFTEDDGTVRTFTGLTNDAKRRAYGESIRDSRLSRFAGAIPWISEITPGGIAGHTDYEAGREVIRNAGRTGVDRAVRDLQDALGGGGGAQPPAPAPAPAPAGGGGGGAQH